METHNKHNQSTCFLPPTYQMLFLIKIYVFLGEHFYTYSYHGHTKITPINMTSRQIEFVAKPDTNI